MRKFLKLWHGITIATLVIAVGLGLTMTNFAHATRVDRPQPPATEGGTVRNLPSGLSDLPSIETGPNTPSGTPGVSQPVPKFSGIDAPWWLNSTAGGSAEIFDDAIIHGLTDVRGGLINNAPTTPRTVTIALLNSTPASGSVSRSTTNHITTRFSITNDSDSGTTLSAITVTREGSADSADIDIKLFDDETGFRLGATATTLNAEGKATFSSFAKGIAAGQTKYFTIKTDISPAAVLTRSFRIKIVSNSDVTISGGLQVTGAPIDGNTFTIAAPTTVTVALASTPAGSSITRNPSTDYPTTRFSLTNNSGAATTVSNIIVTRFGTAGTDDIDLKLFEDPGGQLGTTAMTLDASGKAAFPGLTINLAAGQTKNFLIKTTVAAAAVIGRTFAINISNNSDITVSSLTVTGAPTNGNLFTIAAPTTATIALASTPADGMATRGSTVDATRFSITNNSVSSATFSSLRVTRSSASTAGPFDIYIKLFDVETGGQLGTTQAPNATTGQANFSGFTKPIPAGQTKYFMIRADVLATATVARTFSIDVNANADVTVSSLAVNGAPLSGSLFTINSPKTLTIALTGTPPTGATIDTNTTNNIILRFSLTNNFNSAANVTNITVTRITGNATSADLDLKLFEDPVTLLGTVNNLDGSNRATFSGLAINLAGGQTKNFTIKADISTTAVNGHTFSIGINANEDVVSPELTETGAPINSNSLTITDNALRLTRVNTPTPLSAGANKELLKFTARTVASVPTINRMKFKKEGSAPNANFANFRIQQLTNLSPETWTDVSGAWARTITDIDPSPTAQRWAVNIPGQESMSIPVSSDEKTYRLIGDVACTNDTQYPNPNVTFKIELPTDVTASTSSISLSGFDATPSMDAPVCPKLRIYQHLADLAAATVMNYFENIPLLVFSGRTTDSAATLQNITLSKRDNIPAPAGTRNSSIFSIGKISVWTYGATPQQIGTGSFNPSTNKITLNFTPTNPSRVIPINNSKDYFVKANACDHSTFSPTRADPAPWLYFDIADPNDVSITESNVIKSIDPFTYTGRQLDLCPSAPTVNSVCGFGAYPNPASLNVQWTSRPNNTTYFVEIDNDANWNNGYWRTSSTLSSTNTNITPSSVYAVAPQSGRLNLTQGSTYYVRIYYRELEIRSNTRYITPSACTPPAPIITETRCGWETEVEATIVWNGQGLNNTDYFIDIDNEEGANTFKINTEGGNGFWNKYVGNTLTTTAPLGFNGSFGAAGPLVMIGTTPYRARIYYPDQNIHSAPATFTTVFCGVGYNKSNKNISLLNSLVPTANANFIETAYAQAAPALPTYPAGLINPVTVYDDLYVRGNGSEPGKLVVEGEINVGDPGGRNQINGDLTLNGDLKLNGNMNVTGGLRVESSIGRFYRVSTPVTDTSRQDLSVTSSCDSGDTLVSCFGYIKATDGNVLYGTLMEDDGRSCTARGKKATAASGDSLTSTAMCFSPDG